MMKKQTIFKSGTYIIGAFLALFLIAAVSTKGFCLFAQNEDRYFDNSPCFDMSYRCQVECHKYGLNFTGITEDCSCDCGTGWVSSCSGFYYDKETSKTLVRITGDEVVEYPNGTKEPYGVEAGIYEIGRSTP